MQSHFPLFTVFCDLLSVHSGIEFSVFAYIHQVESCQVIHSPLSVSLFHEENSEEFFSALRMFTFLFGMFTGPLHLSEQLSALHVESVFSVTHVDKIFESNPQKSVFLMTV